MTINLTSSHTAFIGGEAKFFLDLIVNNNSEKEKSSYFYGTKPKNLE